MPDSGCMDSDRLRQSVDAWERLFCQGLKAGESLDADIRYQEGSLGSLEEQLKILMSNRSHLREVQQENQMMSCSLEEEVREAEAKTSTLRKYVADLVNIQRQFEQLNSSEVAEIEPVFVEITKKLEAQQEAVAWYDRHLGFRVQPLTNALRIIFTKLDTKDLDREFSFTICHDKESNLFTLLECSPHIEASKELLAELNQTNQLYAFIRSMRNQFQALLRDEF